MNGTNRLISEYSRQGHPLAKGFDQEDAYGFVTTLLTRFQCTANELNFSPASLKRVEQELTQLYKTLQSQGYTMKEEELVQLVREVAAYIGLVMVTHAGGKWRNLGELWGTEIVFEGPIKVIKGRASYIIPYSKVISLGNIAANAWDLITEGKSPNFYKIYRRAKQRMSKQEL